MGRETQSTSIDAEIVRLLESGPDGLLRYFHPGETPNCPHESVVAAPLIDGPHCVGAIYVATTRGEPRLDKTDLDFVAAVACLGAVAVHAVQRLEALESEAARLKAELKRRIEHEMIGTARR